MRRHAFYVAAVAGVLTGADREAREGLWNSVACAFHRAFRAAHPSTETRHAQAAFRALSRAILAAADRLRED